MDRAEKPLTELGESGSLRQYGAVMTTLNELITSHGPVASVVLNAPSAVVDAAERFSAKWQRARKQLAATAMDLADLARLDDTVSGLYHGAGSSVVLIQCPGMDTFVEFLDDEVSADLVVFDTLARLGTLLESRQRSIPHVVVVADRAGADILAIDGGAIISNRDVEGETEFIHRGHAGGFSQRRYQQRAENLWESNAAQIAEVVTKVARESDARLVAVAGDVRAVGFLNEHLPKDLRTITRELPSASDDVIAVETVRATADLVARDMRSAMEAHRDACGTGNGADGATQTTEALSIGRVARLLIHDDPNDDRRGLTDLDGTWCSALVSDTSGMPAEAEPAEARLVDIAIRSAMRSDAEICFVPRHGGPAEGVGAILRW